MSKTISAAISSTSDFPARFGSLNDAMTALEEHLAKLPPRAAYDLRLACEEIFLNIVNYAYPAYEAHKKGLIRITWVDDPAARESTVTFQDTGIPFNPLKYPPPNLHGEVARRPIGGLGIMLIKKRMDKLDYQRIADKNVFAVTKKWDV